MQIWNWDIPNCHWSAFSRPLASTVWGLWVKGVPGVWSSWASSPVTTRPPSVPPTAPAPNPAPRVLRTPDSWGKPPHSSPFAWWGCCGIRYSYFSHLKWLHKHDFLWPCILWTLRRIKSQAITRQAIHRRLTQGDGQIRIASSWGNGTACRLVKG